MDKTVWRQSERKWKPRNIQAAKVLFPAHGFNLPPEDRNQPVYAESFEQRLARERKAREVALAEAIRLDDEKRASRKARKAEKSRQIAALRIKSAPATPKKERFRAKQLKKMRDIAANLQKLHGR